MADELVRGDRVRLKSGGPLMEVTDVRETSLRGLIVRCEWQREPGRVDWSDFAAVCVRKESTQPGVPSVTRGEGE